MHKKSIFFYISAFFFLTGCATVFTGVEDEITVSAEPGDARIYLDGQLMGEGTVTFTVARTTATERPTITVERKGYETQQFPLKARFNNTSFLNLTSGFSWTTDFASGAVFEYNPNTYRVQLVKKGQTGLSPAQIIERFVLVNTTNIKRDLARGSGDYLDSLSVLVTNDETAGYEFQLRLLSGRETLLEVDDPIVLSGLITSRI